MHRLCLSFYCIRYRWLIFVGATGVLLSSALWLFTQKSLLPLPDSLSAVMSERQKTQWLTRAGSPLLLSYSGRWNAHARLPVYDIPEFLQQVVIVAEDRRFYRHHGVDWLARLSALRQNLAALDVVRGASTISEQVVRLLHPRPRTVWSRWLEGFEAGRLEDRFSKSEILEFYLNQVPYAARRRGVQQASRYYFSRSVGNLSRKEMLALAALIRAPGRLNLWRDQEAIQAVLRRLGQQIVNRGLLDDESVKQLLADRLSLKKMGGLELEAAHFVRYLQAHTPPSGMPVKTTLDVEVQRLTTETLQSTLRQLSSYRVQHAAALVVDHRNGEVLAWANAAVDQAHHSDIDRITALRQPGSTLKPFAYALALERGWTAATLINDAPLTQMVGQGLHTYRNYSRQHYGWLRLRSALGNSLNIPAVRVGQFVGVSPLLERLHRLGFTDLDQHPDIYGDGLVLGNGEVTLQQLVHAYSCLARAGECTTLKVREDERVQRERLFDAATSSIIADILSDSDARLLEFGEAGLMDFPIETALKTGTSNDFRDAWVLGFNHHYTIGIWMGNLDYQSTQGLTGARGPLLALRTIFAALNQQDEPYSLFKDPNLVRTEICVGSGRKADARCASRSEWFVSGTQPLSAPVAEHIAIEQPPDLRLRQPIQGLQVAFDPRLPPGLQSLSFVAESSQPVVRVEWWVNGQLFTTTPRLQTEWPVKRGRHQLRVLAWVDGDSDAVLAAEVEFWVK